VATLDTTDLDNLRTTFEEVLTDLDTDADMVLSIAILDEDSDQTPDPDPNMSMHEERYHVAWDAWLERAQQMLERLERLGGHQ
jgi:hypothetical protein